MRAYQELRERLETASFGVQEQIYQQQMDFARFHNGLVWQVSSIFVPFSFAGLGLDYDKESDIIYFVAAGSIFILVMWTLLAEWHRWLWVHSFFIAAHIEYVWGVRPAAPEDPGMWSFSPPQFVGAPIRYFDFDFGRMLRLTFAPVGVGFWLVRMFS